MICPECSHTMTKIRLRGKYRTDPKTEERCFDVDESVLEKQNCCELLILFGCDMCKRVFWSNWSSGEPTEGYEG